MDEQLKALEQRVAELERIVGELRTLLPKVEHYEPGAKTPIALL